MRCATVGRNLIFRFCQVRSPVTVPSCPPSPPTGPHLWSSPLPTAGQRLFCAFPLVCARAQSNHQARPCLSAGCVLSTPVENPGQYRIHAASHRPAARKPDTATSRPRGKAPAGSVRTLGKPATSKRRPWFRSATPSPLFGRRFQQPTRQAVACPGREYATG